MTRGGEVERREGGRGKEQRKRPAKKEEAIFPIPMGHATPGRRMTNTDEGSSYGMRLYVLAEPPPHHYAVLNGRAHRPRHTLSSSTVPDTQEARGE